MADVPEVVRDPNDFAHIPPSQRNAYGPSQVVPYVGAMIQGGIGEDSTEQRFNRTMKNQKRPIAPDDGGA